MIRDKTAHHEHVECKELYKCVAKIQPMYHIFGHIHEAYGKVKKHGTWFMNVSTCTRKYKALNTAFVFDFKEGEPVNRGIL